MPRAEAVDRLPGIMRQRGNICTPTLGAAPRWGADPSSPSPDAAAAHRGPPVQREESMNPQCHAGKLESMKFGEYEMAKKELARLVKHHAKGQVTIPADFRQKLGIDENSVLRRSSTVRASCHPASN
jgi:hypothetical protein